MRISHCRLTLHESLFYATREIGRLYETGRYLHNYALSYALGFARAPYFTAEQVPAYAVDLDQVNKQGVYVTPGHPVAATFQLATFKYGEEVLHVEMQQATRNTPSFGRAKELAVGSNFDCYVLSQAVTPLPRWIRLGKWMSKVLVEEVKSLDAPVRKGHFAAACALNPLDVPDGMLRTFDIISMPPSSLVTNARLEGEYYEVGGTGRGIPVGLRYNVPATETPTRRSRKAV